jgi:hypothetical protein
LAAAFRIDTTAVESVETAEITASLAGVSRSATITIRPALSLTLNPNTVTGGTPATALIRLGNPAPAGGALVNLRSDSALARVPAFVSVPAGQMSAAFQVETTAPSTAQTITITALYAGAEARATLTVRAATSSTLADFTVTPTTIRGGDTATGKVTLEGAAGIGGVTVNLRSDNPMAVQLPTFITVPSGQTSIQFTFRTNVVPIGALRATLTATAGGVSKSVTVTVF